VIHHIKQINALHVLLNVCCTFANMKVERVIECSNMSVYTSNQIISRANDQRYWHIMLSAT